MNDQVADLIIDGNVDAAVRQLRLQFGLWKKCSNRYAAENRRCQKLAARYRKYQRKLTDGMSDPGDVRREGNQIIDALIDLNGELPDEFWQDEATIAALAKTDPKPEDEAGWGQGPQPPPPASGGNYQPPQPGQQAPQHDPAHVFGRWQLVRVVQNNQLLPVSVQEVATYNQDYSFQLHQNGMVTAWGTFAYQGMDLVINLANGFVDRRKFTCYGNSLLLLHEGNGVYSFYQRLS